MREADEGTECSSDLAERRNRKMDPRVRNVVMKDPGGLNIELVESTN